MDWIKLFRLQGGDKRVIAYMSRLLSKAQSRYCTTYRKLLALVVFFKHFQQYLVRYFKVRTDHATLKWILTFHEPGRNVSSLAVRDCNL